MRYFFLLFCFFTSSAWPAEILSDLKAKRYPRLNQELETMFLNFREGGISEREFGQVLQPFALSDLALEDLISAWLKKQPNTWQAHLAAGIYYHHLAWLNRGADYIGNTSAIQVRYMKSYQTKATAYLTRVTVLEPKLSHAWAYLINLAMLTGDSDEIKRLYQQAKRQTPNSFLLHWNYATAISPKWGGSMKALMDFSQQMEIESKDWSNLRVLIGYQDYAAAEIAWRKHSDKDSALGHLQKAFQYGETMSYLNLKARILRASKNYDKAEMLYQRSLELDKMNTDALVGLAWTYFNQKQYRQGLENANRALSLEPLLPKALAIRARIYSRIERPSEALADLGQIAQYGVMSHSLYRLQGKLFFYNEKDYQSAEIAYRYAAELKPSDERAWYFLMASRYMLKDCRYVDAAKRFVNLCKQGASCEERDLSWSKQNLTCAF